MNKNISKYDWQMEWSGRYSVLSSSYTGYLMCNELKKYFGAGFKNCLISFEKGQAVGYLPAEELKKFEQIMSNKIKKDPRLLKKWVSEFLKQAKYVLALIKKHQKNLDKNSYELIRKNFSKYAAYHAIIKRASSFLPENILAKNLLQLRRIRLKTDIVYPGTEQWFESYYSFIRKELGLNRNLASAIGKTEFENYVKTEKLPEQKILESRLKKCVLLFEKNKSKILIGGAVKKMESNLTKPSAIVTQITGKMAYGGKVRGRVKIVLNPETVKNFTKGSILVAKMTRPEYIPFIKKSVAFITDAGGILSHAAISAREFKIPCVIGTKIATKVLKDRDYVDVDANKGIVKIIKRS